jgi:Lecithin retinol acyltransferase
LNNLADADLPLGCWLVTPRRGFTHHGIYVGHGQVVHYAGLSRSWRRGPVQVVSLSEFCDRRGLWMKRTPTPRYEGQPAVQRALSRVGENRYRVMSNNCEHFCAWCLDGESRSRQVERWLAWPRAMAREMLTGLAQVLNTLPRMLTPPSTGLR